MAERKPDYRWVDGGLTASSSRAEADFLRDKSISGETRDPSDPEAETVKNGRWVVLGDTDRTKGADLRRFKGTISGDRR